jgi:protein gp37
MKNSKIAWTQHTFNPWIGCAKVSAGCLNCYAEQETFARVKRANGVELWGEHAPRHLTSDEYWKQPLRWNEAAHAAGERQRVFCGSMCDWLDDWVRPAVLAHLMQLVCLTPDLIWLLLTKRPEKWRARMEACLAHCAYNGNMHLVEDWLDGRNTGCSAFPRNVWVGVSCETMLVRRAEAMLEIPVHEDQCFISAEPLLGPLDFEGDVAALARWVIVGGESGPKARPCDVRWIEGVVEQCQSDKVPVFVKQLGSRPITQSGGQYGISDLKGGNLAEWPMRLRVQELPGFWGGGTNGTDMTDQGKGEMA